MRFRKPNWDRIKFEFFMAITPRMVKDHFQKQINKSKKEVLPKISHQPDADLIRNAEIMLSKNIQLKRKWDESSEVLIAFVLHLQELSLKFYATENGDSIKCANCGRCVHKAIKINSNKLFCSLCFVCTRACDNIDQLDWEHMGGLKIHDMCGSQVSEFYKINRRAA